MRANSDGSRVRYSTSRLQTAAARARACAVSRDIYTRRVTGECRSLLASEGLVRVGVISVVGDFHGERDDRPVPRTSFPDLVCVPAGM